MKRHGNLPGPQKPTTPDKTGKQVHYLEVKDLLLPVIAALWACGAFVLPLIQELNRIRDKVLIGMDGNNALNAEHRRLLCENDWLPLGVFLVCLCLGFGLLCGSSIFVIAPERRSLRVMAPPIFVGGIIFSTGVLWTATAPRDFRAMNHAIETSTNRVATVRTIAVGTNDVGMNTVRTNTIASGTPKP
jgi:hypothetical protein